MAERVMETTIPSGSTGELYQIVSYDDGLVSCSCPFGSRFGPLSVSDRTCKHVKAFREQVRRGEVPELMAPAFTAQDLDLDLDRWLRRFCYIFSPVSYLQEIVEATLLEDDDHLARASRKLAGETRLRPSPLPELERSVLQLLSEALGKFDDVQVEEPAGLSPADRVGFRFLAQALRQRASESGKNSNNKKIAEDLHKYFRKEFTEGS